MHAAHGGLQLLRLQAPAARLLLQRLCPALRLLQRTPEGVLQSAHIFFCKPCRMPSCSWCLVPTQAVASHLLWVTTTYQAGSCPSAHAAIERSAVTGQAPCGRPGNKQRWRMTCNRPGRQSAARPAPGSALSAQQPAPQATPRGGWRRGRPGSRRAAAPGPPLERCAPHHSPDRDAGNCLSRVL